MKGCLISHSFLSLCVRKIPPPTAMTVKASICFCTVLGAESAPVLMLTSTRVPSSERQSSGWTQRRFPGFGLHKRVSAAPQDDSNYCKHVITQDLLFIGTCFTGSRQWGENDWLAFVPPRILSSQAQQRLCLLRNSITVPAAGKLEMCWLPALCWGLKEASVTPGTGTSEPSQENRPTEKGKSSSSGLVFLLRSCGPTLRVGRCIIWNYRAVKIFKL